MGMRARKSDSDSIVFPPLLFKIVHCAEAAIIQKLNIFQNGLIGIRSQLNYQKNFLFLLTLYGECHHMVKEYSFSGFLNSYNILFGAIFEVKCNRMSNKNNEHYCDCIV